MDYFLSFLLLGPTHNQQPTRPSPKRTLCYFLPFALPRHIPKRTLLFTICTLDESLLLHILIYLVPKNHTRHKHYSLTLVCYQKFSQSKLPKFCVYKTKNVSQTTISHPCLPNDNKPELCNVRNEHETVLHIPFVFTIDWMERRCHTSPTSQHMHCKSLVLIFTLKTHYISIPCNPNKSHTLKRTIVTYS